MIKIFDYFSMCSKEMKQLCKGHSKSNISIGRANNSHLYSARGTKTILALKWHLFLIVKMKFKALLISKSGPCT